MKLLRLFFTLLVVVGIGFGAYTIYKSPHKEVLLQQGLSFFDSITARKNPEKEELYRFAILSDLHSDTTYTQIALDSAKEKKAQYIIVTGDWTKVGGRDELFDMKKLFDAAGLPYYGVPGDHDIYASGLANYKDILGSNYQSFDKNGIHHILMDTSDVDVGVGKEQMDWLKKDLSSNNEKKIFVFMHLPPFHPTGYRTFWEKQGEKGDIKKQATELMSLLSQYGVSELFAGDHHLSSSYIEPNTGLKIRIVGAITLERNLQKPRYDLVTMYKDHSYSVDEVVLSQ